MTIYNYIKPNIEYLVLSINFGHSEFGDDIKSNTSLDKINGFSCCWPIGQNRKFEKIIIYLKHSKEIYLADFLYKERYEKKWKIHFKNTKLIGSTNLDWKDFVNKGVSLQNSMRYIEVLDQTIYPDEIDNQDNSSIFEGEKNKLL